MVIAKNNAYKRLYQKLNAIGGENEVFKLARATERLTRDLSSVRCIKDENGRVLVEDTKVKKRWQGYFCKLFNGEVLDVLQHNGHLVREEQQNYRPGRPITRDEVMETLRKMKSGKAVGPDSIPVEVWKSLGEDRVAWLTDFKMLSLRPQRCHKNRDIVQSSHCTRIKEMLKTTITIGALSYLVTQ